MSSDSDSTEKTKQKGKKKQQIEEDNKSSSDEAESNKNESSSDSEEDVDRDGDEDEEGGDVEQGVKKRRRHDQFDVEMLLEQGIVSKYAQVKKDTPYSTREPKYSVNIEWNDINYKVKIPLPPSNFFLRWLLKFLPLPDSICNLFKKTKEIPILNHVSGRVQAGEVVAIMGPTGSGKTTLLNVLARRIKQNVTGDILINGEKVKGRRLKRRMAYVLQDDLFFANLTVRSTITYTAYMKLPRKLRYKEKRERVDEILTELGLQRCSGTVVGGPFARGVSGGERKRTNIANELVSNPSLIFLDEPTSGLDSSTALSLIVTMKNLAMSGHTVVTTIHQPSSSMFMLFDRVILLAEGGFVVYSGPSTGVIPYFASLGLVAPAHYNPSDFMLELVTCKEEMEDGRTVRQLLIDSFAEKEEEAKQLSDSLEMGEKEEAALKDIKKGRKYATRFIPQLLVMMRRAFVQRQGDIISWLAAIQLVTIALVIGCLWFQMAHDEDALGDRTGLLFFTTIFWTLQPWFNALYSFPPERAVLNKERATGTYRLSAYFLGKTLAESPLELILPFVFSVIVYWMAGLADDGDCFILYLVLTSLFVIMGGSIGLLIGALIVDIKKAMTLSIILVLSSILLGGFFVSQANIPVWIRWARWLSIFKYTYESLLINEFRLGTTTFTPSNPSQYTDNPITGTDVLSHYNVETNLWADFIFIIGMIFVARFSAYLALRFLNKPKR